MAVSQILRARHHITHMNINRRKSCPIKCRGHLHLTIHPLLSQNGHSRPTASRNKRGRNVLITIVGQRRRQTGISLLDRSQFLIGTVGIITPPRNRMAGLTPQRLQRPSIAVHQFKLRSVHDNTFVQSRRSHRGHHALEAQLSRQ